MVLVSLLAATLLACVFLGVIALDLRADCGLLARRLAAETARRREAETRLAVACVVCRDAAEEPPAPRLAA